MRIWRNTPGPHSRRGAAVATAVIVGLAGLTACGDSAGPEAGEVTTEDLQDLEDQLSALDERVGGLEEENGGTDAMEADTADDNGVFDDPALIGQRVTVSAEVSELVTTNTDVGSAFRVAGDDGQSIVVIAANQPAGLDQNDVVRISGTVLQVQRESFEEDFGMAADELFEDSDGFFETEEGSAAISADQIEVLQEQGDG